MLTCRIIPCLDVSDGRVVKGVNFINLKDAGEPVECAIAYDKAGADELCFLDINASYQNKNIMLEKIRQTAENCFMPLTVGGGIRNLQDIQNLLRNGADKVSINTKAVEQPQLVAEAAEKFGSQCITVAIDAKKNSKMKSGFEIFTHGGRKKTNIDALQFAQKMQQKGAGEIILTSIDQDGTKKGFQLELTRTIADNIDIPVIASGGGGELHHFRDAVKIGHASAILAASVFHFGTISIQNLKQYLLKQNINIREKI